jgi:hypothetical protein
MTLTRIEHRTNPIVVPESELLPSQRALLSIEHPTAHKGPVGRRLSAQAINSLGVVLANEAVPMYEETRIESGKDASYYAESQRHLSRLAKILCEYDPGKDPYEGYDRGFVTITDRVEASVSVIDDYGDWVGPYTSKQYFTPEGYVTDPVGDFRQKLVLFRMKNTHLFAEDNYFNFSTSGMFGLYTNNLATQTPRWEYGMSDDGVSDMLPSSTTNPYNMHARPHLIASEERADSVVEAISRTINSAA